MRKLCEINDIPLGQARGFSVQGGPILIHRSEQGVKAYRDACPHLGIDLAWNPDAYMDLENRHIQCSTHGALFEPATGECVFGPCIGQHLTPAPVEIRGSEIWG
jgi:nitrite reductase/ring-hydroxylating ferredoxin subunit